jgi:hypothetical protein
LAKNEFFRRVDLEKAAFNTEHFLKHGDRSLFDPEESMHLGASPLTGICLKKMSVCYKVLMEHLSM